MNVPMLYVNPVTGPFAGRHWVCYVCHFGSEPVLAAFIKPGYSDDVHTIRAVQSLTEKLGTLRAFIVYLSGPDPGLEKRLRRMEQERICYLPLTVLPDQKSVESIYKTLPVSREAQSTLLLYRGRQTANVFNDPDFEEHRTRSPDQWFADLDVAQRLAVQPLAAAPAAGASRAEGLTDFQKLALAAMDLVK